MLIFVLGIGANMALFSLINAALFRAQALADSAEAGFFAKARLRAGVTVAQAQAAMDTGEH